MYTFTRNEVCDGVAPPFAGGVGGVIIPTEVGARGFVVVVGLDCLSWGDGVADLGGCCWKASAFLRKFLTGGHPTTTGACLGGAVVGAAASFTAIAGGCLLGDGCLANSEEATAVKEASSSFLGGKEEEENESRVFGLASVLASVALLLISCGSGPLEAASCGCGWKVPNNPPGCS